MLDITYSGALIAGLVSFLSPCILPIVPFYLSYLTGQTVGAAPTTGGKAPAFQIGPVIGAVFFAAGIITIFVLLGLSASALGQALRQWYDVFRWGAAAIIFVMGLHFLGVIRIGFLYRQFQAEANTQNAASWAGAYVLGLAFAFGWTPCVGPVLAAILFTATGADSLMQGGTLLFAYGVGMTAPFILAAVFVGPFQRFSSRFRRWLPMVEKVMGLMLIAFAVLLASNGMNRIADWMIQTFPFFQTIG